MTEDKNYKMYRLGVRFGMLDMIIFGLVMLLYTHFVKLDSVLYHTLALVGIIVYSLLAGMASTKIFKLANRKKVK